MFSLPHKDGFGCPPEALIIEVDLAEPDGAATGVAVTMPMEERDSRRDGPRAIYEQMCDLTGPDTAKIGVRGGRVMRYGLSPVVPLFSFLAMPAARPCSTAGDRK